MNAVGQPTARRWLRARPSGSTFHAFPRWFSRMIPRPQVIARSRSLGGVGARKQVFVAALAIVTAEGA